MNQNHRKIPAAAGCLEPLEPRLLLAAVPTVSISVSHAKAAETVVGAKPSVATLTFKRTGGDLTVPLTIDYNVGGSATPGADYTALAGSVTLPAGAKSAKVAVAPLDDAIAEATETVIVTLLPPGGYVVKPTAAAATVSILDNEPVVSIAALKSAVVEGLVGGFKVTRKAKSLVDPLTVTYSVAGSAVAGGDYTALSGVIVIPAGAKSATISLVTADNAIAEASRTVTVTLAALPPPSFNVDPKKPAATVTITDNEPTVWIAATDSTAAEGVPVDNAVFTVSRSGGNTALPLVVDYTVSGTALDGTDFTHLTGQVTIPAHATSAVVTVHPLADGIVEPTETATLTLTPTASLHFIAGKDVATANIKDRVYSPAPPTTDPKIAAKLQVHVTLVAPYSGLAPGSPATASIRVDDAVVELLVLAEGTTPAGLAFDWNASFANTQPACWQYITPDIVDKPLFQALQDVLDAVGLTYTLTGGTVTLVKPV